METYLVLVFCPLFLDWSCHGISVVNVSVYVQSGHLFHKFAITESDWYRIKQSIDSKCRTAWRRKQRGQSLAVKSFSRRTPASQNSSGMDPCTLSHQFCLLRNLRALFLFDFDAKCLGPAGMCSIEHKHMLWVSVCARENTQLLYYVLVRHRISYVYNLASICAKVVYIARTCAPMCLFARLCLCARETDFDWCFLN